MLWVKARNYIQRLAKVSHNVIQHIPNNQDNLPTRVIKVVSLIDTAQELVYGKRDPVKEYLSQYELKRKSNLPFVSLFFSNLVADGFDCTRIAVSNDITLLRVNVTDNDKIFFTEHKYENHTERSANFYHTPGFDFNSFMDQIWSLYNGRIYVTLDKKDYRWKPTFSIFPVSKDPVYGSAKALLKKISDKNTRAQADGVSRSYMFFGPPGSGKSSFAHKLGADSNRVIKFDAKSFDSISKDSVSFLLEGLMPDYIIIDDVDKVIWGSSVATLLCILESIKIEFPNTTIIVTANETRGLDPAMFRAGRLDEPIKFDVQDKKDRRKILCKYADSMGVGLTEKQIDRIIKKTSGLSAAYLKEVIIQLKYSTMKDVLEVIETMKTLLGIGKEEKAAKAAVAKLAVVPAVPAPVTPKKPKRKKKKKPKKRKRK